MFLIAYSTSLIFTSIIVFCLLVIILMKLYLYYYNTLIFQLTFPLCGTYKFVYFVDTYRYNIIE